MYSKAGRHAFSSDQWRGVAIASTAIGVSAAILYYIFRTPEEEDGPAGAELLLSSEPAQLPPSEVPDDLLLSLIPRRVAFLSTFSPLYLTPRTTAVRLCFDPEEKKLVCAVPLSRLGGQIAPKVAIALDSDHYVERSRRGADGRKQRAVVPRRPTLELDPRVSTVSVIYGDATVIREFDSEARYRQLLGVMNGAASFPSRHEPEDGMAPTATVILWVRVTGYDVQSVMVPDKEDDTAEGGGLKRFQHWLVGNRNNNNNKPMGGGGAAPSKSNNKLATPKALPKPAPPPDEKEKKKDKKQKKHKVKKPKASEGEQQAVVPA